MSENLNDPAEFSFNQMRKRQTMSKYVEQIVRKKPFTEINVRNAPK